MKYFFDTYAIIEIIKENQEYSKFREERIITSILNLGELYYALNKDFNENLAEEWVEKLKISTLNISLADVIKGMKFRLINIKRRLSFVDCVSYITAKKNNLIFLTGDRGFKGLSNVEFID